MWENKETSSYAQEAWLQKTSENHLELEIPSPSPKPPHPL